MNPFAARIIPTLGRKYEEAVKMFPTYDKLKESNSEAREAARALVAEGKAGGPERKTFIYMNNRLEGNSLETIDAMISDVGYNYPRTK